MTRRLMLACAALSLVMLVGIVVSAVSVDTVTVNVPVVRRHNVDSPSRYLFRVVSLELPGRRIPLWFWDGSPLREFFA